MDYDQLQFEFKHAVSIRLIRSEYAPLILSFLHL